MKGIEALENMVRIQSSNGNWNCNIYMWGFANGLILALATMKNEDPVFLDRPDVFLDDLRQPVELSSSVDGHTRLRARIT